MKLLQSRIEKDFETFVRMLPSLEPNDFCGLCKILCIDMYLTENDFRIQELETISADKKMSEMTAEESAELMRKVEERAKCLSKNMHARPLEDIMNDLMDGFLKLDKRKRRQILCLLKDYKRGL